MKKDFLLDIIKSLRKGLRLRDIAKKFNISKQNLHYHISVLKRIKAVDKIGYGVWEVYENAELKVKKLVTKSTRITDVSMKDLSKEIPISKKRFKEILHSRGMDTCVVCDNDLIQIHRIKPESKGGINEIFNLIPLCPNHHLDIHKFGINDYYKGKINSFYEKLEKVTVRNRIRGHGFQFRLKVKELRGWNQENRIKFYKKKGIPYYKLKVFGGGEGIVVNKKKVWITNKSVIIFDKASIIKNTAKEVFEEELNKIIDLIEKIEGMFKTSFKINGKYKFKVTRQHYARMKDDLAKEYNRKNKKLYIYNEKGLWFVIDNSFNLEESETVHPKTAKRDMDKAIVPFFNSLQENQGYTPRFVLDALGKNLELMNGIQQNQLIFDRNMKSHLEVLDKLGNEVKRLSNVISGVVKENKKLKLGDQTTLGDF